MSFNASIGANVTNIGQVAIEANIGTDSWYFTSLLFAFFIIFFGLFSRFNDTKTTILADLTFTTLLAVLFYFMGQLNFTVVGILIALTLLMLFYYLWDD